MSFGLSVLAPHAAREAIEQCVGHEAPPGFLHDALLLTSELVANAVMHTDGRSELRAVYDPGLARLRVEVSDRSPVIPTVGVVTAGSSRGGLGLRIIECLAERWGTTALPSGKSVWFELGSS